MFEYKLTVRLQHTDAAGVVFFAHLFAMAHECYEAFLDNVNSLGHLLANDDVVMPIVHAEADFKLPLRVSDKLRIEMRAQAVGRTSFTLDFTFRLADDRVAARVSTVHAVISRSSRRSTAIPEQLLAHLTTIAVPS